MKKNFFVLLILVTSNFVIGSPTTEEGSFAIKEWNAPTHKKPILFYISGDGGFNKFSTSLCEALNKDDFDVIALNSKIYFDDKKTPEQTTLDITNFLSKKLAGRQNQQVIFIGYSFGADVLPFVLNRLPKNFQYDVKTSFILASSGSTDFEIHWSDLFGGNSKRSMDVVTEINKLQNKKIVIIDGTGDHHLDRNLITIKYTYFILPGGHHFDGDIDEVANQLVTNM
jgi:type IV secretory pathway VirJ component